MSENRAEADTIACAAQAGYAPSAKAGRRRPASRLTRQPVFPATLFDYNGVLVDDEAVHFAAFRDALAPLGIELDEAAYWERYLGFDDVGAFRAILTHAGRSATDADVSALVQAKRPIYLERARTALRAFPGAAELVRRRAASGPVLVVSGALRHEIVLGLDLLGVAAQVSAIIAAEDTHESKPDPEGYRLALDQVAARAGEPAARQSLVIEDSLSGIEAAKAAGLCCLAVAHTYKAEELCGAGADLVVENVAAISDDVLEKLYRRLF